MLSHTFVELRVLPCILAEFVQPLKSADRLERHVSIRVDKVQLDKITMFRLLVDKCPLLATPVINWAAQHEPQRYRVTDGRPPRHIAPRGAHCLPSAEMLRSCVDIDDKVLTRLAWGRHRQQVLHTVSQWWPLPIIGDH